MAFKANVEETLKLWNKEYKKGFFAYITLLMLKEKTMYGFEINNRFLEVTGNRISFQASAIYQILKKLSSKGFVKARWRKSDKGPNRKYYTITAAGDQLLRIFTESCVLPIHNGVSKMVDKYYSD
ncbi:MAG: PadR family transcriptional regulator [candidate division Zixibacteria bacterium]|nr:PadR family transcriptional regulator [candidate division Zixibacteria bacterium]